MKILVTLLLVVAAKAATGAPCAPALTSYLRRQLTDARLEGLAGHFATLVERDRSRQVLVIGAERTRDKTVLLRLLDRATNETRVERYPYSGSRLKRVLVHDLAPEVAKVRRDVGADVEFAGLRPGENALRTIDLWLDKRKPLTFVIAREGAAYGLETVTGTITPWTGWPEAFTVVGDHGAREIKQARVVAACGPWAGF